MESFDVTRRFPTFERWLEIREPGPREERRDRCFGCLRPGEPMSSDGYCEACLRYHFGGDEAELNAVRALLGGAVKSTLAAGVSIKLVRRVVDAAIDEARDEELESVYRRAAA